MSTDAKGMKVKVAAVKVALDEAFPLRAGEGIKWRVRRDSTGVRLTPYKITSKMNKQLREGEVSRE